MKHIFNIQTYIHNTYIQECRILDIVCQYLNNIEDNILVETIQNALGDSVIVPGPMNHQ